MHKPRRNIQNFISHACIAVALDRMEILISFLEKSLPENLASLLEAQIGNLENANFEAILEQDFVRKLLDHENDDKTQNVSQRDFPLWTDYVFHRLGLLLSKREANENPLYRQYTYFTAGLAAIGAFLQSNVTGPPIPFSSAKLLFDNETSSDPTQVSKIRKILVESLSADGEAAYKLTPNIELLCLADAIITYPPIMKNIPAAAWARLRTNFLRQRLLSDVAPSLQKSIYEDLKAVEGMLSLQDNRDLWVSFLLERATVHLHHGFDKEAKEDIERAAKERHFEFALTGLLGKRTKYQQKDVSQLIVLAHSTEAHSKPEAKLREEQDSGPEPSAAARDTSLTVAARPQMVDLNDDTLLDSISFAKSSSSSTQIQDSSTLPPSLATLDPSSQPMLQPLDSIILLLLADTITNTNPADGLTREETLPYATRVLEGGSSNWQVYTQALLLRSRIEGYKSRTVERGLLQLQALVDQVIAETTGPATPAPEVDPSSREHAQTTSFLPKPKESESAPASERLRYIFQLCTPYRWSLEAELASRWVSLGGLRSALDIYERLEMWPEAALCWAATEREDKARRIIRRQLFRSAHRDSEDMIDEEAEEWEGAEREPAPVDAPRLWCILGDIDKDPRCYEKAWEVSNQRYARAQRSLGRFYYAQKDFAKASLSYSKALKVKQIDHPTWFALGCCLLKLSQFKRAVEAFGRAVQLDDQDAEAWSNLAGALLNLDPNETTSDGATEPIPPPLSDEEETSSEERRDGRKHVRDALRALKQAARLKSNDYRIWSNLLTLSASLEPPSWPDVLTAQSHIIDIRGNVDGESSVDVKILSALVSYVVSDNPQGHDPEKPGLSRILVRVLDEKVVPLITANAELWHLMSKVYLWRNKPSKALGAEEKAWRTVTQKPGWETGTEKDWNAVVQETEKVVKSYEELGQKERTEGMAAGSGEVVEKQWKFKARSAIRSIMGRGKASWEDTEGWGKLQNLLNGLKG